MSKGQAFSIEALFALLAAGSLLVVASLHSRERSEGLERLYEYELLNDFLQVESKAGLNEGFVSSSGFCVKLEEIGGAGTARFLPSSCERSEPAGMVSATRVICREAGCGKFRAGLWRD